LGTDSGPDRLPTLVQLRSKTDARIGSGWILLAIASYALWIVFAIFYFDSFTLPILSFQETTGLLGTLAFTTSTGLSFLVYSLISRQNKHATREQEIAWEILNRIQSRTGPDQTNILLPLSSAERDFSNLLQRTREQSAILWSLLVLVPFAGWVFLIAALFLLTRDSNVHESVERSLFEDLDRTLTAGGMQHMALDSRIPPSRNGTFYALVSVITLGIVALSWLYIMIIGEEAHFRYHSILEPRLLLAFRDMGSGSGGVS
jgi:hypothetical protein